MNSAVGSALIAAVLSGVFVIVGVLLGARMQGRSADRERTRLAAEQRDDILASLAGATTSLLTQATWWHNAAWRRRVSDPLKGMLPPGLAQKKDDPRLVRIEGQIERLRRDVLQAVSEISVLCSRLVHVESTMQLTCEQFASAVMRLTTAIWDSDAEFKIRSDEVAKALSAMDGKRKELAGKGGLGDRHGVQGQQA